MPSAQGLDATAHAADLMRHASRFTADEVCSPSSERTSFPCHYDLTTGSRRGPVYSTLFLDLLRSRVTRTPLHFSATLSLPPSHLVQRSRAMSHCQDHPASPHRLPSLELDASDAAAFHNDVLHSLPEPDIDSQGFCGVGHHA